MYKKLNTIQLHYAVAYMICYVKEELRNVKSTRILKIQKYENVILKFFNSSVCINNSRNES